MKSSLLSALFLGVGLTATAAEPLTLTFERTGTDAAGVTVAADLSGVSATLSSVSHALKPFGSASLCADANGNTSPTIVFTFNISGIPAGWSANQIGLDVTGYNAAGNRQQSNDGKRREFNVAVDANGSSIAHYANLDPAAGVENAQKVWETTLASTLTPAGSMELKVTVTKGADNQGCFFGLNSITLSTDENVTPEPPTPPTPPSDNKVYTIKWKNNTSSYMTAQPDGSIQIGSYATSNRVFWEFIPTGNEDCYYIRNTANGLYIGSCNLTPSSNSRIAMSTTPVEYYVHRSASTSGDNQGCYWMSSTDCANYNTESAGARCLNKDGASNYIITWTTGVGNVGSYWTLTESADLYEPRPFSTDNFYYILNADRQAYNYSGAWVAYDPTDKNARWQFDGEGNSTGGYTIINPATNAAINNGARYKIASNGAAYSFVDSEGNNLQLAGCDAFTFVAVRTAFALNNRIFQMPCGSIGDTWIASVSAGAFHYPMTTAANGSLVEGSITARPSKYEILTRDAISAAPGSSIDLAIELNKVPAENYTLTLFADFDRDGLFEYSLPLTCAKSATATIEVPENAKCGDCRLRLRLNANGLSGADDDVMGEILDLKLKVANPAAGLIDPVAKPNDPNRGSAQWANNLASATSKGNALFLFWQEGMRVVSAQPEFEVEPAAEKRVLVAVFSANTDKADGIDPVLLNTANTSATIAFNGSELSVCGAEPLSLLLFGVNGQLVASTTEPTLSTAGLLSGVYIAKAITSTGIVSAKIIKQ